ncbi:MAG TPA: hypothetical protein VE961_28430 [Pyrinomonadaceae bacterium]|nr:hypothetical protein [Pyrinomonadaceae bacterium]
MSAPVIDTIGKEHPQAPWVRVFQSFLKTWGRQAMKKTQLIFITIVLLVSCSSAESVLGQMKSKKGHGQKRAVVTNRAPVWEYKITSGLTEEEMNKLGAQGWELAGTFSLSDRVNLYFKRRLR